MWIPPATTHDVRAMGAVRLLSLYIAPSATTDLPGCGQVVGISPFMRSLISEALKLPLLYDVTGMRAHTQCNTITPQVTPCFIEPEAAESDLTFGFVHRRNTSIVSMATHRIF